MTVYVQRDGSNAIIGVYTQAQPGYAVEALDDSDPAVVAFLASLTAPPTEAQLQDNAATLFGDPGPVGRLQRAAALVVLDRVNELREWITSFKAATAAATSLANLQSRVANLPNMPDYSADQIKTAIKDKINNNASD